MRKSRFSEEQMVAILRMHLVRHHRDAANGNSNYGFCFSV
jgi:hypothetical protein